jgi:hypothetical protein
LSGDFPKIEFMGGKRLALAPDQTQLLHLLKGIDAHPGLFSGALVELRKVWLTGYLPKQVLMG